jgi:uncharacterized glyoxalase superfamily protein PhnB
VLVIVIKSSVPIIRVRSSLAAERFYCEGLGFRREFIYRADPAKEDPCYMGLARDGARLHVSSFGGDGVVGSAVYLYVEDVDGLYREVEGRGVEAEMGPTDQDWGTREIYVRDPDGNCLRFGESRGR